MPDIAPVLACVWRRRLALIDTTYILEEFGRERLADWLPPMFERVRKTEVRAIPIALLSDLNEAQVGYRAAISGDERIKFGIRVPLDEMVGPGFPAAIAGALAGLGLTAADCVVVADFGGAEFSDPAIVAPIIGGALETLQELGLWQQIIFQGSHYPERNPAPDGGVAIWPRNEWKAWRLAVKFDPTTAEHMIFGDYAADCSKIDFGISSAKPIRHLRYTTGETWRIQRGTKNGADRDSMHRVYGGIASSSDFAGASFSEADAYIARAAADPYRRHGNAMIWRQLNTTHHITQVVNDIAMVRGVEIKRRSMVEPVQISLLAQS